MPERGSGLVRECYVSDAASSSDVPAFADKRSAARSAPSAEIVAVPEANRDLCITSALRGNACQDALRPFLSGAQSIGANMLNYA